MKKRIHSLLRLALFLGILILVVIGDQFYWFIQSEKTQTLEWDDFSFTLPLGWTLKANEGDYVVIDVLPTLDIFTPFKDDDLELRFFRSDLSVEDLSSENGKDSSPFPLLSFDEFFLTDVGVQFYVEDVDGGPGKIYWAYNDHVYGFSRKIPKDYQHSNDLIYNYEYTYPEFPNDFLEFLNSIKGY